MLAKPWIWSFVGALLVWLAAIAFTGGYGAGGMITAALSLAVFMVIVGVGQMFVITLGPGNVDLSLPANIGLASAVAMKVMDGSDSRIALGLAAALACGAGDRRRQLSADLGAAHSADHRHPLGKLHHPVDRHQLWPRPADQAAAGLCRFHQPADSPAFPYWRSSPCCSPSVPAIVLDRMIYGRSVSAIGQNMRAAWLAGIPVERIRFLTYTLSGTLGGLDGALLAGYFRGANVDIGNEYLLASIAVVVIGGTSVAGGKANVPGIWGAALFLVLLLTMLNTFGVSAGVRLVLTGLIIVGVITAAGGPEGAAVAAGSQIPNSVAIGAKTVTLRHCSHEPTGGQMERRLTAILAADVVGYCRLMGLDEAGTLLALKAHRRELADGKIAEHQGRIVKLTGDGMLVEFPSVVNAVACAADIQRGMRERNADVPEERRIEFRIGVNLGDIIVEDDDIFGDGVNVAARLEGIAQPGGITISASVRDHVGDRLDLAFEDWASKR